ncbi:unnamed protein product [Urochloa humidicola]
MCKVKKEKQRRKDKEMSSKSDKLKPQKKPFKKSVPKSCDVCCVGIFEIFGAMLCNSVRLHTAHCHL